MCALDKHLLLLKENDYTLKEKGRKTLVLKLMDATVRTSLF